MKLLQSIDFVEAAEKEANILSTTTTDPVEKKHMFELHLGLLYIHCKLLSEKLTTLQPPRGSVATE